MEKSAIYKISAEKLDRNSLLEYFKILKIGCKTPGLYENDKISMFCKLQNVTTPSTIVSFRHGSTGVGGAGGAHPLNRV